MPAIKKAKTARSMRNGRTAADHLMKLVDRKMTLFRAVEGEAFARLVMETHREVFPVDSPRMREWLQATAWQQMNTAPTSTTVETVIRTLVARAKNEGKKRRVHLRTAKGRDAYYIDIGGDNCAVIKVGAEGWRVLAKSPVLFTRAPAMQHLPKPKRGGSLDDLRSLLNVSDDDWLLIVAWLIEALRPDTPYVGLQIIGPQGSSKSTTQSLLRDLIDPSEQNLRIKPSARDDVLVAARSNLVVSYENLSDLSANYQDVMCSMLTGGGAAKRKLYSNDEEFLTAVSRPIMLNGINRVVTRPDLQDRFVTIELPEIDDRQRRAATDVKRAVSKMKGSVFGGLLDTFVETLRTLEDVRCEKRPWPRMADFAQLGEAVARAMGRRPGAFLRAYRNNQRAGAEGAVESTPLGESILATLANGDVIDGTYSEVSERLRECVRHGVPRDWPRTNKVFGDQLRRLTPSLKRVGIEVDISRKKAGYACRIWPRGADDLASGLKLRL